jgi:hypothetical protein
LGQTTLQPVTPRHWRSYGNEPLSAPQEALGVTMRAALNSMLSGGH